MKHYLQFKDLSADEYTYLFERAAIIKKKFKAYALGYFHVDIAEVQTAEGKLYLFVAIHCLAGH